MKLRIKTRRRSGFTLVETIVTVGLLAVLAAFVVPTVIQKASAGDPVQVVSDLTAIRTGMETFLNDVKGGFPNQVSLLVNKPTTANHFIDSVTNLTPGQVAAWNGPYLGLAVGTGISDSISTGFRSHIHNVLSRYDAVDNVSEHYGTSGAGTGGIFNANASLFAAVTITGLSAEQAQMVNRLLDGQDDLDVVTGPYAGANITGRFRYDVPNAGNAVVAYYLVSPINK